MVSKDDQPEALPERLLALSTEMNSVGRDMLRLGGLAKKHGHEMIGAAGLAAEWASEVHKVIAAKEQKKRHTLK